MLDEVWGGEGAPASKDVHDGFWGSIWVDEILRVYFVVFVVVL